MINALHGLMGLEAEPTPPVTSGLVHYLHANGVITMDASNNITSWKDRINNVTWTDASAGATSNKAQFRRNGFNSRAGVYLNNSRLLRPSSLSLGNTYTVFELSNSTQPFISLGGSAYNVGGYFLSQSGASNVDTYHSAAGSFAIWAGTGSQNIGLMVRHIVRNTTSVELVLNGVSKGSVAISSGGNFGFSSMGDYAGAAVVVPYVGTMRCQLAYNRVLSAGEIAQVLEFLNYQK